MIKTAKTKALLLLVCACLVFFLMALLPAGIARADAAENNVLEAAIDSADIEILDGAQASTESPYVMRWIINIPDAEQEAIETALSEAWNTKADDYIISTLNAKTVQYRLLIFDESKIPELYAGLYGVKLTHEEFSADLRKGALTNEAERAIINGGNIPLRNPGIVIGDETFYPEFDVELTDDQKGTDGYKVSIYTGADQTLTNYVPILVVYAGYATGFSWYLDSYFYTTSRLIYNPNAVRSLNYVSQSALSDESFLEFAEDDQIAVLNENVTKTQAPDNLAESEVITDLEKTNPLNFTMQAGATLDATTGGISWSTSFDRANFDVWKNNVKKITLWWIVLEYDKFIDTGNVCEDFPYNYTAAKRIYAEYGYTVDGNKYVSTLTYTPENGKEHVYYIAIPFIKVVGIKASATAGTAVGFSGVASGTYVLCNDNDNARSINNLINDDGTYTYTFTYLEAMPGKPFAEEKTKTITRTSRIDFNGIEMADFASIIGLELDSNGDISCLLSKVNYWFVQQPTTTTYAINAMYTLVPLTFTNEKMDVEVQYLGLIPFSNIDGTNEYATLLTALKDKDGNPYFKSIYDIETSKVYGYFYTYSYESELDDPNWEINQSEYNGYISYFTRLENVSYKMGYMEIGNYGALGGAVTGLIIGTIVAGPAGALVGAVVGGVAGYVLAAGVGSLFGAEQDSHNIYYNVEYGFLDCTTMTPGGFYKTKADPELQVYEKIALVLIAVFELYFIATFAGKAKRTGPVIGLILTLALLGVFVWGDIALYQYFLTGI